MNYLNRSLWGVMAEKEKKRNNSAFGLHWLSCMFDIKKYHRAYDIGYESDPQSQSIKNSPSAVLISVCFLLESKKFQSFFWFFHLSCWQTSKTAQESYESLNLHWKRQNERKKHLFFFPTKIMGTESTTYITGFKFCFTLKFTSALWTGFQHGNHQGRILITMSSSCRGESVNLWLIKRPPDLLKEWPL